MVFQLGRADVGAVKHFRQTLEAGDYEWASGDMLWRKWRRNPLDLYDDNGNGRITCAEVRRHGIAPVPRSHPAYRYMRDADGDGVVCE